MNINFSDTEWKEIAHRFFIQGLDGFPKTDIDTSTAMIAKKMMAAGLFDDWPEAKAHIASL